MAEIDELKSEMKKLRADVETLKNVVADPDRHLTQKEALELHEAEKEYESGKSKSHPDFE